MFTINNLCIDVRSADFPTAVIFSATLYQVLISKMLGKQTYGTWVSAD